MQAAQNQSNEKLVANLYQAEKITFNQAQKLLQHNSWKETAALLEQHGCVLHYDEDDFVEDLATIHQLHGHATQ